MSDDWFERALRDLRRDDEEADDGGRAEDDGRAEDEDVYGDDDADPEPNEDSPETDIRDLFDEQSDRDGRDPAEETDEADSTGFQNAGPTEFEDAGPASFEDATGDESAFDPFESSGGPNDPFPGFENANRNRGDDDARDTGPGAPGPTDEAGADPFGGVADESEEAGDVSFDPAEFMNLSPGGGPGDYESGSEGFSLGPSDERTFDDADFDSSIDRVDIGIRGLDEMILGGVPERSLMVAIGSAGTGKTTFGLQFLTKALRDDGKAVYITLEESRDAILSTAEEKGWPFREWCEEDRLAVVALDPIEMANSLASIRSDIARLVTDFGADRLVLDSVSLLEMMYDHPAKRRSEVFDFARSLKQAGVTTMLTSEANDDNPYTSRYGIVEYLVDAVFILQYVRPSDFRETRLAVEIQKIRDANHSRETKPYEITSKGISVYRQANIF